MSTQAQVDPVDVADYARRKILPGEIEKYLVNGRDFIDPALIERQLADAANPDPGRIRDILAKALEINSLAPPEAAALLNVSDPKVLDEMRDVAGRIKRKVYDNRIVTFAPLYVSNLCVNKCVYCGFRADNPAISRRRLEQPEIKAETEVLAGRIGHKRLIAVFGEHPSTDADYIAETLRTIYAVSVPVRKARGQIRRVNVNAAPLSIADLKTLHEVGIGTFQVFQETYHPETYRRLHPAGTLKADFRWRLYCMHRSMEAGVDDVGIGALFGLYDWRFEVMGLLAHARDLERQFGIGPHTVSFPRIEPAANTPFVDRPRHKVSDADFEKLLLAIRIAIPYTGMILTARENAETRTRLIPHGVTQIDASSRIGIGAYSDRATEQKEKRQQFILGDTRTLDEVIRGLARAGLITSFCTAGYRCGRTGKCIMDLLRSGQEGKFCKLNAILTFREWLDDFASEETRQAGEAVIASEIEEVRRQMPKVFEQFIAGYEKVKNGTRDLYF